jgi:dTDP-4-dehydrorhamnose reductase
MSTDRVLITGAGGMLGNAIYPYFSSRYSQLTATDKDVNESWLEFLDVRDTLALKQAFASIRPTLVLHLAACTDLEFCEVQIDTARETNADATGEIARLCEEYSATLVYISTAGIFDGTQQDRPYVETDEARPIMVYGQTKFDGEKLTAKYCSRHFIVRAGWMVGGGARKDKKFVHHILGQILAGEKVLRAVNDRWGTPTYTHDFALNLFRLLDSRAYGTYHMVCEGSGTRYDVARAIIDITGHKDVDLLSVDSSYFEAKYFAPRPVSEMMENANLRALGINLMRPWRVALQDYIAREFDHALAGNFTPETLTERRVRGIRRKQVYEWNGPDRRKLPGRRHGD